MMWFFLFFYLSAYPLVESFNLDMNFPIIYMPPNNSRSENVYFGFTVGIRPLASSLENLWSIQIGAPKENFGFEAGAVFRCSWQGPCQIHSFSKNLKIAASSGIYAFKDKTDRAWVGGSMDFKKYGSIERSVVCGHRWINQNLKNSENIDITYLMTGVCYLQDFLNHTQESSVLKLLPLVNSDKIYYPKPYVVNVSTYYWGLGQAGTSVLLTEFPSLLVIGAPGVAHWLGSVICYDSNFNLKVGNFGKTTAAKKNQYSYIGYSLAAGKFYADKKLWFAASAPRAGNYRGEVFIFQFAQDSNDNVHIKSVLKGSTFGEYFGYSITSLDLNGDGYDDLVVGSPLYSKREPDEGRIYVYLGGLNRNFLFPSQIINGQFSGGRFGSCISSLHDLDKDGYNDVAIGAPYENDLKGAIYLYRGYKMGLHTVFSQRIRAEDLHPQLRGFGFSISAGVDIDGNNFNDVVIGAYLSDQAVLLRSRPVIFLHPEVKAENFSLINRRGSYLNFSVCTKYTGIRVPLFADVVSIVEIDPHYSRGYFSGSNSSYYKKLIRLKVNEVLCETISVFLDLSGNNYLPLKIIIINETPTCVDSTKKKPLLITNKNLNEQDKFGKWCPVGIEAKNAKDFDFAGECDPDSSCISDLKILCTVPEFERGWYIIGSTENYHLTVDLLNSGEPASNTKIKISSQIEFRNENDKNYAILEGSNDVHWHNIHGFFSDTYKGDFTIKLTLDKLSMIKGHENVEIYFVLNVDAQTSNIDEDLSNNRCKFYIRLLSNFSVALNSYSSLPGLYLKKEETKGFLLNVTHYYEVIKTGPTPILVKEMTLYIPLRLGMSSVSYYLETPDSLYISEDNNFYIQNNEHDVFDSSEPSDSQKENYFRLNRVQFVNCSNDQVPCRAVKLFSAAENPIFSPLNIAITITFNISGMEFKKKHDIIHFTTSAILIYKHTVGCKTVELVRSASLNIFKSSQEKLDIRVIVLSIFTGALLLIFIVFWLAKNKFFKRTKKQELNDLMEASKKKIY